MDWDEEFHKAAMSYRNASVILAPEAYERLVELAKQASIADTAGAKPAAQVSIRDGFIVGGINYGLAEGKHELYAAPPAPSAADAAGATCQNCGGTGSHGGRFHTDGKGNSEYEPYKCDVCDGFGTIAKESGND